MFNVNLDPLIHQIKEFNNNQLKTNQLLIQQNQLLTEIKELLIKKYA
jgi:hypothetical protein